MEQLLLRLAGTVVSAAFKRVLTKRHSDLRGETSLSELVEPRTSFFVRRSFKRHLQTITDSVAQRLQELYRNEFTNLDSGEQTAATLRAIAAFEAADMSDKGLFAVALQSEALANRLLESEAGGRDGTDLSEAGEQFYRLLVHNTCECLVQLVINLPEYQPRVLTELLERISQIEETLTTALERVSFTNPVAPQGADGDEEFRAKYLHAVKNNLDVLDLFGVDLRRYNARTTLSVAYIGLSVRTRQLRSTDDHAPRGVVYSQPEFDYRQGNQTVRVERVLGLSERILIRGEAGSGKSTLLRWLAVNAARSSFDADLADLNGMVPFLIKLRSWEGEKLPAPEHFLADTAPHLRGLMPEGFVHRALESGRALLLIDGVDELPNGERAGVRNWLSQLVKSFPKSRWVVTSRRTATDDFSLHTEGFGEAMLAPMSSSDVRQLIRHWHLAIRDSRKLPCRSSDLPDYERDIRIKMKANADLRALATTPLLCAMLCALNLDRRRHLPTDRVELYRAAMVMLIDRRDAERQIPITIPHLGQTEKRTLLRDLAWRLSLNNRTELPRDAATARIAKKLRSMPSVDQNAEAIFEYLLERSGVIREPQSGRVDFIHRTFQEFLAADQAADNGDMGLLVENAHRDEWHEIVTLAAGLANAPQRSELITGVLNRADTDQRYARRLHILAASCLETMPDLDPGLGPRMERALASLLPPRNRSEAISLARIGPPLLRYLPRIPERLSEAAASSTILTAALVNGPKAVNVLRDFAADSRRQVQEALIDAWSYFNPKEYAREVLANAPLVDGAITVNSQDVIPVLSYLQRLRATHVALDSVDDISILNAVPCLASVDVRGGFDDVAPLEQHGGLESVRIRTTAVFDPTPLTRLPKLRDLALTSTVHMDLSFLADCESLLTLFVQADGDTDLSPIWSLTKLTQLGLWSISPNTDLSRLSTFSGLRALSLGGPPGGERSSAPRSIASLPMWAPQLRNLTLFHMDLEDDLAAISALPALTGLGLYECSISNLEALIDFTSLRSLQLDGFKTLPNLAVLAKVPQLKYLYLRDSPEESAVIDLAPFADRDITIGVSKFHEVCNVGPGVRVRRLS